MISSCLLGIRAWSTTFLTKFLILALTFVQGCQELQTLSIEEHLERAQLYQEQQDFEDSILELKVVLQGNPDHTKARLLLAKAQLALGDASSAECQLRRARKLGMSKQNVQIPLLHALILQNKYEEVLIESDTSLSKAPTETLLYLRGLASFGLGRFDDARAAFEQALHANPQAVDPLLGLAKVSLAENHLEEADGYLQPILNQRIEAWLLKGQLEMLSLNFKEAEQAFSRVLNKYEHYVPAKLGQIRSLLALGNTPAAMVKIEQTLKRSPQLAEAHYLKAISALLQDDLVVAQASAWEAVRLDQHHMPSIGVLGFVDHEMGHLEQAEANLSRYLRTYPEDTTARKTLAATRFKLGLTTGAIDALQSILEKNPDDPSTLMLLGTIYLANLESSAKDHPASTAAHAEANISVAQVRAILEGAVREQAGTEVADSKIPSAETGSKKCTNALKAIAYLSRKNHDKALEVIDHTLEKYPNDALILATAGMIYNAKGDTAQAFEKFKRAEELDPAGTDASLLLAQLAEDEKDSENACAHYFSILQTDSSNTRAIQGIQRLNCQALTAGNRLTKVSSKLAEAKAKRKVKANQLIKKFLSDIFDQSTRLTADFALNKRNARALLKIVTTPTHEERSELYRMLISKTSSSNHSLHGRAASNAGVSAQQTAYSSLQTLKLPPELQMVFNAINKVIGFLAKIKELIYNHPLITVLIGLLVIVIFELILRPRTRKI
jgi:putative PEP-CTERM system TPR-repeat lipoprotein